MPEGRTLALALHCHKGQWVVVVGRGLDCQCRRPARPLVLIVVHLHCTALTVFTGCAHTRSRRSTSRTSRHPRLLVSYTLVTRVTVWWMLDGGFYLPPSLLLA